MRILTLVLSIISFVDSYSQKLAPVKIGEDISIKIPISFVNMSNQDRMARVASSKVPLGMFSTESQEVTLGINDNIMQWKPEDTKVVYGFYKASINALFDEIQFIQDTIKQINGREFVVFEFVSTIRDENVFSSKSGERNYTYIQYTSYKDQVLLFNFGAPARLQLEWEDIAKEVMQSVKIK
ncbi:MAG: hypothetical protein ABJG78_09590 [Cyclobacteriaceae bacterium]